MGGAICAHAELRQVSPAISNVVDIINRDFVIISRSPFQKLFSLAPITPNYFSLFCSKTGEIECDERAHSEEISTAVSQSAKLAPAHRACAHRYLEARGKSREINVWLCCSEDANSGALSSD